MQTADRLSTFTQQVHERLAVTDAARWLCLKAQLGTSSDATVFDFFAERYPRSAYVLERKASVPPIGIGSGGDALLPPSMAPLVAAIQKATLPSRLALRTMPFNTPIAVQSVRGTFTFVLQGLPKPATRVVWTSVSNPIGKVSGVSAFSRELMKLSGADAVIAATLTADAVQDADKLFLDPAVTLDVNGRPASISNAIVPIVPVGTTLPAKVAELLGALFAGRPQTVRPALIATPAVASQLAAGQTVAGAFNGVPVFASTEAGALVIALDRDGVIYSEDVSRGSVDVSEEATLQLDSAPSGASPFVSLWQTDMVGFRAELWCWWQRTETNSVQVLQVT